MTREIRRAAGRLAGTKACVRTEGRERVIVMVCMFLRILRCTEGALTLNLKPKRGARWND